MGTYRGLDQALKWQVFERDQWRCRWCGRVRAIGFDAHHIRYRRGSADDTLDNLVTLCRDCHDFVHSSRLSKAKVTYILRALVCRPGTTGLGLRRRMERSGELADV